MVTHFSSTDTIFTRHAKVYVPEWNNGRVITVTLSAHGERTVHSRSKGVIINVKVGN